MMADADRTGTREQYNGALQSEQCSDKKEMIYDRCLGRRKDILTNGTVIVVADVVLMISGSRSSNNRFLERMMIVHSLNHHRRKDDE